MGAVKSGTPGFFLPKVVKWASPLAVIAAIVLGTASPAAAHGSGAPASNWRTRILDVSPEIEGLDIRVIDAGARLELTNRTGTEAVVLGYEGEPYLRVGPEGVFENVHSAATWSNRSRDGAAPPDDVEVGPDVAPEWHRVSSARTARWHDHRAHWMQENPPKDVVRQWEAPILLGDQTVVVGGDLSWVPGPNPLPWAAIGLAGAAVVAALAARSGARAALMAGVGLLLVADVVHGVGTAFARPGGVAGRFGALFGGSALSLGGWGLAVAALVLLWRRRSDGLVAAGLAAAIITSTGGLLELADLTRSQVPFALPVGLARAATALSLALGVAVAAVVLLEVRHGPGRNANSSQQRPDRR
jgi:hypothetical protein